MEGVRICSNCGFSNSADEALCIGCQTVLDGIAAKNNDGYQKIQAIAGTTRENAFQPQGATVREESLQGTIRDYQGPVKQHKSLIRLPVALADHYEIEKELRARVNWEKFIDRG